MPALIFSGSKHYNSPEEKNGAELIIYYYFCPYCKQTAVEIESVWKTIGNKHWFLFPDGNYINYPDYIPQAIRNDYEEAWKIINLSPKASATLARRCLQGIIRDFWGIKGKSLYDEINAIEDKVEKEIWEAIDGIRNIGNIGAHMEKDVNLIIDIEPDEAESLLRFIELLIQETYINKMKRKEKIDEVIKVAERKAQQKSDSK